jgi:hypothetical protein
VLTNEPLVPARGPVVVELGYERVVFYETSLAARLGYTVYGRGPEGLGRFVPISGSVSVTRYFDEDPFADTGLSPFVMLTTGFRMIDLRGSVHVREDPTRPRSQPGNDLEQELHLWKRAGDGFVGIGAGTVWKTSLGLGLRGEIELSESFPYSATVVRAAVGVQVGL